MREFFIRRKLEMKMLVNLVLVNKEHFAQGHIYREGTQRFRVLRHLGVRMRSCLFIRGYLKA